MDVALALKAVVMGVVEGLTEFLPISSTGHLILAGDLLGLHSEKTKVFEMVIQTGAMLAVVWEYRAKFMQVACGFANDPRARRFVYNLILAFMPAAILGQRSVDEDWAEYVAALYSRPRWLQERACDVPDIGTKAEFVQLELARLGVIVDRPVDTASCVSEVE